MFSFTTSNAGCAAGGTSKSVARGGGFVRPTNTKVLSCCMLPNNLLAATATAIERVRKKGLKIAPSMSRLSSHILRLVALV